MKLFRSPSNPPEIFDDNVPILCVDRNTLTHLPWDIAIRHLLHFIDGVSFVKKISAVGSNMDIDMVKKCLRTLVHYNCAIVSDILQFTNIYQLTPAGKDILVGASHSGLFQDIIQFCAQDRDHYNHYHHQHLPSLSSVQRFLASLRPGKALSSVIAFVGVKNLIGINIRRLLAYTQHLGLVRRIHEYPIDTSGTLSISSRTLHLCVSMSPSSLPLSFPSSASTATSTTLPTASTMSTTIAKTSLCSRNGLDSLDSICTSHSISPNHITQLVNVVCILK